MLISRAWVGLVCAWPVPPGPKLAVNLFTASCSDRNRDAYLTVIFGGRGTEPSGHAAEGVHLVLNDAEAFQEVASPLAGAQL